MENTKLRKTAVQHGLSHDHSSRKQGRRLVPPPRVDRPGSRVGNNCGSMRIDGQVPIPFHVSFRKMSIQHSQEKPTGVHAYHESRCIPPPRPHAVATYAGGQPYGPVSNRRSSSPYPASSLTLAAAAAWSPGYNWSRRTGGTAGLD
jgi:hypothetical protein